MRPEPKIIDLGAGHSSAGETLCGRIIGALKAEALLNENVGTGYIDRHWPLTSLDPALVRCVVRKRACWIFSSVQRLPSGP